MMQNQGSLMIQTQQSFCMSFLFVRLWNIARVYGHLNARKTIPFICFERIKLGHRKSIALLSCKVAHAGLYQP